MKASFKKYTLNFKRPAGTSRGILYTKETYFIFLSENGKTGIGEAALFKGLSYDDIPEYENRLQWLINNIQLPKEKILEKLKDFPSIIFGWEQAFLSLKAKNQFILFPTEFTQGEKGIPINGLIWMGDKKFMFEQIKQKLSEGFQVIKLKIGAIDFQDELDLLRYIRSQFSPQEIELRLDANGAFEPKNALDKLKRLSAFQIHSIEQPIKPRQFEELYNLCRKSPIPIALDEELIGYNHSFDKVRFLKQIQPQYIILKPALHGGFIGTDSWIDAAEKTNTGWWITSALESNIGLNAIAQFTADKKPTLLQGLGTGSLFTNNFNSPLSIKNGELIYQPDRQWNMDNLM